MTIGKGKKIGLWNCAWVQGRSPRDIAPSIFKISRRKDIMLDEAPTNNTWISDIVLQHPSFSANHFVEFIQLWTVVQQFTESKQYSASSTYHAQFLGAIATNFNELICWLAIRNRIWTADRLSARGWPHNHVCRLCRRTPEIGNHLFIECRFTRRIWMQLAAWVATLALHPTNWELADSVQTWWSTMAMTIGLSCQGLRSLIMLTFWEIWKERNARIFEHIKMPSFIHMCSTRKTTRLADHVRSVMMITCKCNWQTDPVWGV
ncbi:hypothetical protein PVAP13_7NG341424 [Panicum virgatum]|uniref:Reverse transcriptase zinc-binding domain-containing protein n=1 Tax=Panicum virgatum TaxID=38727 RepID=A0A8T0Q0G4_PANVG|nr:hypothetical protein PVAP13_7NG341424 [Panicum virgatum]